MALANAYVNVYGQLGEVFNRIAEGQAPEKFTVQYLKDLGFTSSNYRAVISLLKALGFLTPEGVPTSRYLDYRNTSRSRRVMGEAVREAYADLFTIKANPTEDDFELIEGKFRSAHNATANTAKLMANTFYSLLKLADISPPVMEVATPKIEGPKTVEPKPNIEVPQGKDLEHGGKPTTGRHDSPTLHYNIQIHLPATKDVEVFNAIFKSLREHLLD